MSIKKIVGLNQDGGVVDDLKNAVTIMEEEYDDNGKLIHSAIHSRIDSQASEK